MRVGKIVWNNLKGGGADKRGGEKKFKKGWQPVSTVAFLEKGRLEPPYKLSYRNKIWQAIRTTYKKHFQIVFSFSVTTGI